MHFPGCIFNRNKLKDIPSLGLLVWVRVTLNPNPKTPNHAEGRLLRQDGGETPRKWKHPQISIPSLGSGGPLNFEILFSPHPAASYPHNS